MRTLGRASALAARTRGRRPSLPCRLRAETCSPAAWAGWARSPSDVGNVLSAERFLCKRILPDAALLLRWCSSTVPDRQERNSDRADSGRGAGPRVYLDCSAQGMDGTDLSMMTPSGGLYATTTLQTATTLRRQDRTRPSDSTTPLTDAAAPLLAAAGGCGAAVAKRRGRLDEPSRTSRMRMRSGRRCSSVD